MGSLSDELLRDLYVYAPFQASTVFSPTESFLGSTPVQFRPPSASSGSIPAMRYTNSSNYKAVSNIESRGYHGPRSFPAGGYTQQVVPRFYNQQTQSYNDLLGSYPPSPASPLARLHSMYHSDLFPLPALHSSATGHFGGVAPVTPAPEVQPSSEARLRVLQPFEVEFPNFQGDGRNKPPYPYVDLLAYAIKSQPSQKMSLADIYAWLLAHFPWFRTATSNWKNSVRHNLSLNKRFVRVPRGPVDGAGKGDLWTVEATAETVSRPTRNRRKSSAATTNKLPYERKVARRPSQKALRREEPAKFEVTEVPELPAAASLQCDDVLFTISSRPPTPHLGHPLSPSLPGPIEGSSESFESLFESLL